ncbi:aldo/keto reductase [Anaerovibrio sp. RM50]|uniref:aldo/keto reductase n=1 Tax=Anaerovibrio sp. RM50 TaxID=1200557 RepID=UPI00055B8C33|nr:aldo/keto reductase [Anaerovibrio sp. RM50]
MKKLPKIALGAWSWGTGMAGGDQVFGNNLGEKDLKPIFDVAMKHGLNLWDTATVYGMGSSEDILGSFVKGVKRDEVIISTKFTPQIAEMYDNSMEKMADASMKRLGIDDIDIYWIHNPADVEQWTPQLAPLVKNGKVKAVGVSNHNLTELKRANEILSGLGCKIEAVQNHFSLLNRSSETSGILDYCKENDIIFFAYMVLEQGALSGKYDTSHPFPEGSDRARSYNPILPQLEELTKLMQEIGEANGISVAQVATAWAINKGTLPIIGVTKVHHVEDAVKAAGMVLTNDEISRLESVADKANVSTIREWEKKME